MSLSETSTEALIQAKGLNAPRLTPDHIDAQIIGEDFCVFDGTTVTVCVLMLRNGFTVTGESACASPANFDEAIGRKIARENARAKIWPLEGYLLRERLTEANQPVDFRDRVRGEKADLDKKLMALTAFISKNEEGGFAGLADGEKDRLRDQRHAMQGYSEVLEDRIAAFEQKALEDEINNGRSR